MNRVRRLIAHSVLLGAIHLPALPKAEPLMEGAATLFALDSIRKASGLNFQALSEEAAGRLLGEVQNAGFGAQAHKPAEALAHEVRIIGRRAQKKAEHYPLTRHFPAKDEAFLAAEATAMALLLKRDRKRRERYDAFISL